MWNSSRGRRCRHSHPSRRKRWHPTGSRGPSRISARGNCVREGSNIAFEADQRKWDCLFSQIYRVYSSALLNRFLLCMSKRCLRQVPDTREPVERCFVPVKKRAPLERGAHFNKRFLETSDFTSVGSDNNPGSDLSLFNIAQSDHLNPAQLARRRTGSSREKPGTAGTRQLIVNVQAIARERLNRLPSLTEKSRVARLDPHCAVLTRLSMRL
jgi:hypothetical protein